MCYLFWHKAPLLQPNKSKSVHGAIYPKNFIMIWTPSFHLFPYSPRISKTIVLKLPNPLLITALKRSEALIMFSVLCHSCQVEKSLRYLQEAYSWLLNSVRPRHYKTGGYLFQIGNYVIQFNFWLFICLNPWFNICHSYLLGYCPVCSACVFTRDKFLYVTSTILKTATHIWRTYLAPSRCTFISSSVVITSTTN